MEYWLKKITRPSFKKKKKLPNILPIFFFTWTDEHDASIVSCNGPIVCTHYSSIVIAHKQLVILIQLSTKGSAKGRKQGIYIRASPYPRVGEPVSSTRRYRIVNWAQFFLRTTWQQSLRIFSYFCVFVSVSFFFFFFLRKRIGKMSEELKNKLISITML